MGFVEHSTALEAILFNTVTDDLDGGKKCTGLKTTLVVQPSTGLRILKLTIMYFTNSLIYNGQLVKFIAAI